MPLSRWMVVIGLVMGLGCLRVTQHHAVVFKAYAVGAQTSRLHEQHNEVDWLNARIVALASPAHLGEVVEQRHLKLIARSTLPSRAGPPKRGGLEPTVAETKPRHLDVVLADGDTAD